MIASTTTIKPKAFARTRCVSNRGEIDRTGFTTATVLMPKSVKIQLNHLLSSVDAEYVANLSTDSYEDQGSSRATRDRHNIHIEQMATLMRTAISTDTTEELNDLLHEQEQARELEIKRICDTDDNPLLDVPEQLNQVSARTNEIRQTVDIVGKQMERSSRELIEKVTSHVHMRRTRMNVESSLNIVRLCLQALEHTNQVQELLKSNHRVAAVQSLQDLQSMELEGLSHIGMGTLISQGMFTLTKEITTSTLSSLGTFFQSEALKKHIAEVGKRGYSLMHSQRKAWENIVREREHLRAFRLNSPVEVAYRRSHENFLTESQLHVDLGPLYEAEMVFDKLGRTQELAAFVESKLTKASDSLATSKLDTLLDTLPNLVGFCLFDRTLSQYLPTVRSSKMVDDNWERLAQNVSAVVGASFSKFDDFRSLKNEMSMLMDILQNFDFNVAIISDLLRNLVTRLSEQILQRAKREFLEKWQNGDQMQVVVTTPKSLQSVMSVIWYNPEDYDGAGLSHGEVQLPKAMPFSEVYVIMCRHLRTLIEQGNSFLDHFQQDPGFVENAIARTIDVLLKDFVCARLSKVAEGHNRELIVQTLINLQLFYLSASEIEKMLGEMRVATGRRGSVALEAKNALEKAAKDMETRVHVLLEETVREFFETGDFDWHATEPAEAPSTAVLEMTTYLLTMANTLLKRLPPEVRLLAYFNLTENIGAGMRNMLYDAPSGITAVALDNFDIDLSFLETSISELAVDTSPSGTLLEARQIVELLRSEEPFKEYSDPKIRNRKYGRITVAHASQLIRKVNRDSEAMPQSPDPSVSSLSPKQNQSGFMRYLSGEK